MALSSSTLLSLLLMISCSSTQMSGESPLALITEAQGNGILSCRPKAKFPRDCGSICECSEDGQSAVCTEVECPKNTTAFEEAIKNVYREWSNLMKQDEEPLFRCKPNALRKVPAIAKCVCVRSGQAELCWNEYQSKKKRKRISML